MVDIKIVQSHHQIREELKQLEFENEKRKNLIRLAVLRIITLSNKQTTATTDATDDQLAKLTKKNTDYELYINKLKQESSTKEKLQQSKLEAAKEEIARLKQQLNDQAITPFNVPTSTTYQPNINSTNFRMPGSFYSSTSFGRFQYSNSGGLSKNYLSPTFNSINKSIYVPDTSSSILTPIQSKRKLIVPTKARKEYTNYNKLKKTFENAQLHALDEPNNSKLPTDKPSAHDASTAKKASPGKSPSRQSFVENFDRSSKSHSPSPDFTPSKIAGNVLSKNSKTSDSAGQADSNSDVIHTKNLKDTSTSSIFTEEETFASANSTLGNATPGTSTPCSSPGSIRSVGTDNKVKAKKKKKKKLKLWKAEASKISLNKKPKDNDLNLEEEGVNSLTYYQDANFANEESPPKISRKREIDEESSALPSTKRKKKHVFKID